jgi:transcriptional regulator GlxA family with amidase domain
MSTQQSRGSEMSIRTEVLIYDHFEELDAFGPYNVLAKSGFDVAFVTAEPADWIQAAQGTAVIPHRALSDRPDLLVVPGGPWTKRLPRGTWAQVQRGVLPPIIAERHARGATVASVCTGAFLLAAGGLLDGRPATTHHDDLDDLEGTAARVIRDARVVDDGDIVTAAGVTSGIDMGLWLVERYVGREVAERTADGIEHRRDPRVWRATETAAP